MDRTVLFVLSFAAAFGIWFGFLFVHYTLNKITIKIQKAQKSEDIATLRCGSAETRMRQMGKAYKFMLLVLIVLLANFVINAVISAQNLLSNALLENTTLLQLLTALFKPMTFISLFAGLGAVLVTKRASDFFRVLHDKCKSFGQR